ncbi:tachykinin-like peptides receptor 99D isoform X1 [Varroa jacobsoni]|uniref:tachykinin-like peptides receptor 99D isoform X1 n=2 Tax=Varroa jacobsoni TaxID=62625 RepID=UPI000BF8AB5A|nr:tachykinin-like peptides receptor 99D isoform X1 [Varroa jacobsoni]XP_022703772.1 tachykinin-like peptides receptor 99D isoform X1 [Varroa jacobsoni]
MDVLEEMNLTFFNISEVFKIYRSNFSFEDTDYALFMPIYMEVIWCILFSVMIVVAACGNLIVIWIVLAHKRMRTVTNYFIVNLSIADTMVSTLNVIFNFTFMLRSEWWFGEWYCKFSNFVALVSVSASVFTLMAISIDRYMAIMHPLHPRMSRMMTLNIALCIWLLAGLLACPQYVYSRVKEQDNHTVCYMFLDEDGEITESRADYLYNLVVLIVTYIIPMQAMAFTYFRVGRELWGQQSIGEVTRKQTEAINSKRKIVKMMIVIVAIFGVCWLPYHLYFLLVHHYPDMRNSVYIQNIYLTIYFLAMSNSMYNPVIYCWMNSRFREGFKAVFCCYALTGKQLSAFAKNNRKFARYSCASEPYSTTRVTLNHLHTTQNINNHQLISNQADIDLQHQPDGSASTEPGTGENGIHRLLRSQHIRIQRNSQLPFANGHTEV